MFKNFSILTFSKIMAVFIIMLATSNFILAFAADAATTGFTWESVKGQVLQWIIGVFAASLTVIAGYVANLIRYAIKYIFDLIRTYIANTRLSEMLTDLETFCTNETTTVENLVKEALKTNNDVNDEELNTIAKKVAEDAKVAFGAERVKWAEQYRPEFVAWLTSHAKNYIRKIIDSFRARQSQTVVINNTATK